MAKILLLHEESGVRARASALLVTAGHEVAEYDSVPEAHEDTRAFDLYICGQLGKYSDGLAFATDMVALGRKALILSERHKFSRIPFFSSLLLSDGAQLILRVENILAGD